MAPKIRGAVQIIALAIDDESRQFAFVHECLKIERPLVRNCHMKYLHTMVRVTDIEQSLRFYRDALGLEELSRKDHAQGRYTLVFLAAPGDRDAQVELTYNWDPEDYGGGRNFGHLAYAVEDIYATCRRLMEHGVLINRPPRDGRMAFVRSPDNISVELLQKGAALAPAEPWKSMPNTGTW
jgi:lactoylglutathione lyase